LEDTLLGHILEPYREGRRRKAVATSKFYLFDVGVTNALLGRKTVERKTPDFGRCLEQLIFLELKAYLDYRRSDAKLCYWRSQSQLEVDFVVGGSVAIEVKGTGRVSSRDLRGLRAFAEETRLTRQIVVCDEGAARKLDDVDVLPYADFLRALWEDRILQGD
jgi:predicted AAA+ superfamily ATPase